MAQNGDWGALHTDLQDLIVDRILPAVEDLTSFSNVCMEWESAAREKLRILFTNQQTPMLLLPDGTGERDCRYCLYDVARKENLFSVASFRSIRHRRPRGEWICRGSSHGWLILAHSVSNEVVLRKPLSGRGILLPPVEKEAHGISFQFSSFALSADPDSNRDQFVLMVKIKRLTYPDKVKLHQARYKCMEQFVAIYKSRNKRWIRLRKEELIHVRNVVYSNGAFYMLTKQGSLHSCEVSSSDDDDDHAYKLRKITPHGRTSLGDGYKYLLASPEGDVLLVRRIQGRNLEFVIHKLLMSDVENPSWIRVTSLGDVALFLGKEGSVSDRAAGPSSEYRAGRRRKIPGCQPNSIYFWDGTFQNDHGTKVFNLSDGSVTSLQSDHPCPIVWISPKTA